MLRAAICGAGHWGTRLIESVQGKSAKIRFVTAVTRNPAALQDLAGRLGVALTNNYADVLADPGIDAIVLATPHSQHAAEIIAAAKARKPVFAEKPFTLTRSDAQAAITACKAAGVTLGVGFNRRFAPAFLEMTRRIGEIGTIRHIEGHFSGPANYQIAPGNWRANQTESPGGGMTARGVHVVDGMIHLAGLVETVFAFSARRQIDIDVDDTTSCLLRFEGGVTGYLATLHAAPQFWRIHVFGSNGALEMRGDNELRAYELDGKVTPVIFEAVDKERAELEAFADAVANKTAFTIAPEEIVNTVAVTEAIVDSSRSGKSVKIAL
jgi:predicted dehydrogenase